MPYKVVSKVQNPTENTYNSWDEFCAGFYKTDEIIRELKQKIINNNDSDALLSLSRIQRTNEWDVDTQTGTITRIYESIDHYNERESIDSNARISKILETVIEKGEVT